MRYNKRQHTGVLCKLSLTSKLQLIATISSGSGTTFNVQLLFLTSTLYFQLGICTGQTSSEFPTFINTQRYLQFYQTTNDKKYLII